MIGIGINVNQTETDLPSVPDYAHTPTSLFLSTGYRVDRTLLLIALCRQLDTVLGSRPDDHSTESEHHQTIYQEWRALLHTLGQPVSVHLAEDADVHVEGIAVDTAEDGALIVAASDGTRRSFRAGDVTLRSAPVQTKNNPFSV